MYAFEKNKDFIVKAIPNTDQDTKIKPLVSLFSEYLLLHTIRLTIHCSKL